jgi:hypothetical protein
MAHGSHTGRMRPPPTHPGPWGAPGECSACTVRRRELGPQPPSAPPPHPTSIAMMSAICCRWMASYSSWYCCSASRRTYTTSGSRSILEPSSNAARAPKDSCVRVLGRGWGHHPATGLSGLPGFAGPPSPSAVQATRRHHANAKQQWSHQLVGCARSRGQTRGAPLVPAASTHRHIQDTCARRHSTHGRRHSTHGRHQKQWARLGSGARCAQQAWELPAVQRFIRTGLTRPPPT